MHRFENIHEKRKLQKSRFETVQTISGKIYLCILDKQIKLHIYY